MKIAAGVGKNQKIIKAIENVDFEVIQTESEEELVKLLFNGHADAAIRGSLSASKILVQLKEKYPTIARASFIDVKGHKFLLTPVGIDEGDELKQKLFIAKEGAKFLTSLGIKPKIGILSGGRSQDYGRSTKVDDSLDQGKLLTSLIQKESINAKHYHILIEDAIKEGSNLIIATDGIYGNLIFRTLIHLGNAKSHGAVTLGMKEIFIDTSRSQNVQGYKNALKFAYYLANLKKQI